MTLIARLARRIARLPATAPLACAAFCLALAACSQPTPTPLPTSAVIPAPTERPAPTPQSILAAAPTERPAPTPQSTLAAAPTATPSPPSVAIPTPAAQPTPAPTTAPSPSTDPPADVAFTQLTAGKTHACGLRENGAIICWGDNSDGQTTPPQGAFSEISAGRDFTCALRQDATIACWGDNSDRQAPPPQGAFSEIAAGRTHACALPQGAPPELVCWGKAFPDGAETLTLDAPLSGIQAGGNFTCGLTPQADMACLSINTRAIGITHGPFTQLAAGLNHVCALREDSSAYCQRRNDSLQASPPPTQFAQIAAGRFHSCGITRASRIECWGSGRAGAPGQRLTAPDGEFDAIAIGWQNSCALRPNKRAICWETPAFLPAANFPDGISPAFGGAKFRAPVELFPWPSGGLAVVEHKGVIAAHSDQPDAPPPKTILDLTHAIGNGMFSAALDPRFEDFPFLYVWYGAHVWRSAVADNVLDDVQRRLVGRLARFRVDRGIAIRGSELAILDVHISSESHIGGAIRFGEDGMLYLGISDNGKKDDAQALDNLNGKIIRIDVRGATPRQPYRIPPDNPFVDTPGARPEIWAYGMRNPWRMAFDPKNPDSLFVADVGESTREEVSIATAGANLGWPLCEADICQESLDVAAAANLTSPVVAYGRDVGCAVIGGVTVPWLDDGFIFSDLCAHRVWLLERNSPPAGAQDSPQAWRMREIANLSEAARGITAFGAGADGSVYALSGSGPILRLRLDPSLANAPADE